MAADYSFAAALGEISRFSLTQAGACLWKPVRPDEGRGELTTAIAFGGNGQMAVGDFSGRLRIYESSTSDSFEEAATASGSVTTVGFSQDGLVAATAGPLMEW